MKTEGARHTLWGGPLENTYCRLLRISEGILATNSTIPTQYPIYLGRNTWKYRQQWPKTGGKYGRSFDDSALVFYQRLLNQTATHGLLPTPTHAIVAILPVDTDFGIQYYLPCLSFRCLFFSYTNTKNCTQLK